MLALNLEPDELAEALYLAHLSAEQIALEHPHDAPPTIAWTGAPEAIRNVWLATAQRLLAFYGAGK